MLLVEGRVRGTWRLDRGRIAVEAFEPLTAAARDELAADGADLGRFLGRELTVEFG